MALLQALNVKGIKNLLIRLLMRDRKRSRVPLGITFHVPQSRGMGPGCPWGPEEDAHLQCNGMDATGWIQSLQQGGLERNLGGFKQELPFCWDTSELPTALLVICMSQIRAEFLLDRGTWGVSSRVFARIFAPKLIPSSSHVLPVSRCK